MQGILTARFIGVDHGFGLHALADRGDGLAFRAEHKGEREAATLAHDHHDLPLAGLVHQLAATNPVLFVVGRPDVTADIGAIHFDFAGKRLELAKAASTGVSTVKDLEGGRRKPIVSTLGAMKAALERAGIGFVEGDAQGITFDASHKG